MSVQVSEKKPGHQGGLTLMEAATALSKLLEAPEKKETEVQRSPCVSYVEPVKTGKTVVSDDEDQSCKRSAASSKKEIFPQRLMAILDDPTLSNVITWLPNGYSFVIVRPDVFTETVLPKYLPPVDARGSTKYPSFTRKLNRWGFRQITRGPDTGAFHHPLFCRDEPHLCLQMVCQRSRDRRSSKMAPSATSISLPPKKRLASLRANRPILPFVPDPNEYKPVDSSPTTTVPMDGSTSASSVSTASNSSGSRSSTPSPLAPACIRQPVMPHCSSARNPGAGFHLSKDATLIAKALRQNEENERLRIAKAMLYQSYLQAVHDKR